VFALARVWPSQLATLKTAPTKDSLALKIPTEADAIDHDYETPYDVPASAK
jgi:hypothetical protein